MLLFREGEEEDSEGAFEKEKGSCKQQYKQTILPMFLVRHPVVVLNVLVGVEN